MPDTSEIQLCNISGDSITWSVTPVNAQPIHLDQEPKQYGAISVPLADRYLIKVGEILQAASSPSVLAVYTDSEIIICSPA